MHTGVLPIDPDCIVEQLFGALDITLGASLSHQDQFDVLLGKPGRAKRNRKFRGLVRVAGPKQDPVGLLEKECVLRVSLDHVTRDCNRVVDKAHKQDIVDQCVQL